MISPTTAPAGSATMAIRPTPGTSKGSPNFRAKCEIAFERKLDRAGMFMITSAMRQAEKFGQKFYTLERGQFVPAASFAAAKTRFEDISKLGDDLGFIAEGLLTS